MNLLFLTSEYPTECKAGGLATYVLNIVSLLQNAGHHVIIVTASDKNNNKIVDNHIQIERVYVGDLFQQEENEAVTYLKQSYRICKRAHHILRTENIDLVHYSNHMGIAFFLRTMKPTVCRISSDPILWREAQLDGYTYEKCVNQYHWSDIIEYASIKKAKGIFGPGRYIGKIIEKRIHRDVRIIESPYHMNSLQFDRSLYESKLAGKRYIVFYSALIQTKGILVLAECIGNILRDNSDLYIVLAGRDGMVGPVNRRMKSSLYLKKKSNEYSDRCIYLGTLTRNKLYPIVENSLACIQPTIMDNFPNTCIEAMALSKIVIGTYGSGCEQLIRQKENGILIRKNSSESLQKAIQYLLLLTDKQRNQMGQKAFETVERQLNEKVILSQLLGFYQEVRDRK